MKPACYITPAQLQVLQGFGGAGQVQLKVRTRADETHTVELSAIPADKVLVPRELLIRILPALDREEADQLRTLLNP